MSGNRRQYYLLAMLGVTVVAYLRFGGVVAGPTSAADVASLPQIDADGLSRTLEKVSTVNPSIVPPKGDDSVADRNLFQYGERKPLPPPPMSEAQRKAEEDRLRKIETEARAAAEQARIAEEKRQAEILLQQQLQQQQPPEPPPPPPPVVAYKPPKPTPTFKFMGVIGPPKRKFGIFLEGEQILMAKKGEVISGKFTVLEIGPEWAELGYVDPKWKGEKTRIDFGKQ